MKAAGSVSSAVVIDASFAAAWLLEDEASAQSEEALKLIETESIRAAVPSLWYFEMLNLIRSAIRRKRLDEAVLDEAVDFLNLIPVEQHSLTAFSRRQVATFAHRHALSAYDASYLVLALRLDAPLLTADASLKATCNTLGLATELPTSNMKARHLQVEGA